MAPRNFVYHRYMLNEMKREALAPSAALTAAERAAIAGACNLTNSTTASSRRISATGARRIIMKPTPRKNFLAGATLPTLILHALDDPWVPAESYTAIDWSICRRSSRR